MYSKSAINSIFDNIKAHLIDLYIGDKSIAESLIDVDYKRCHLADKDHWKDDRVYMHTGCEELLICVSSSIELLSKQNLQGIFIHEFGHIIDFYLSDMYESVMDDEELVMLDNLDDDELKADYLIERLFGIHIFYDNNKIQWVNDLSGGN